MTSCYICILFLLSFLQAINQKPDKQHYSTTTHCHGSYAFARLSCCNVSKCLAKSKQKTNASEDSVKLKWIILHLCDNQFYKVINPVWIYLSAYQNQKSVFWKEIDKTFLLLGIKMFGNLLLHKCEKFNFNHVYHHSSIVCFMYLL